MSAALVESAPEAASAVSDIAAMRPRPDNENDALPKAISPFAQAADALLAAGYTPIPILPREKAPGEFRGALETGSWTLMNGWNSYAHSKPTPASIARWKTWPDANVGITLGTESGGYALIAIDFDTDDQDELELLQSQIPRSRMEKRGTRGYTAFYRASKATRTKRYMIAAPTATEPNKKRCVLEILTGNAPRQTVMPPSMHPHGHAYEYRTADAIVPIDKLPVLSDAHFEQLEDTLEHLGWVQGATTALQPRSAEDDVVDICRQVNDIALQRLHLWVGELSLPKLRPHPNGSWEAVPFWRPSNSGNPTESRKPNLKFHREGIKDMGTDVGYTPLDVVSAAFSWDFDTCFRWLNEKTGLEAETNAAFDLEAIRANFERRRSERETAQQQSAEAIAAECYRSMVTWDDRQANASLSIKWLIKGLLPACGVSVMYGRSGSAKSFVSLDLAVSVATNQWFFGKRTKAAGGTLFALGEAAGSMPDRLNAVRLGKLDAMQVIHPMTGEVMNTDRLPISWFPVSGLANRHEFETFAKQVRLAAEDMQRIHGQPLRLLIVDTMVASFGFDEDPDASTVTRAMKQLDSLAQELNILVLAIHHAGKSVEAGEHGSYAWRGSAETSIHVDCKKHALTGVVTDRRLLLVKNRHGVEGWNQPFSIESIALGVDEDGDEITSATVDLGETAANDNVRPGQTLSVALRRFTKAFEPVEEHASFALLLEDGKTVAAVKLRDVKAQYLADNTGKPESIRTRWGRDLKKAHESGLVSTHGEGAEEIAWRLQSATA